MINDVLNKRSKELCVEAEKHENFILAHTDSIDSFSKQLDKLNVRQNNIVTTTDIELLKD